MNENMNEEIAIEVENDLEKEILEACEEVEISEEDFEEELLNTPEYVNEAIDAVDEVIYDMFLSEQSITELLSFRSDNWNKLDEEGRKELCANFCAYLSALIGETIIYPGIIFADQPINGQNVTILNGSKVTIYNKLFEAKNVGVSIIADMIREIKLNMIEEVIEDAMSVSDENYRKKLKGKAKLYYENKAESWLTYSWVNFYSKDHVNYSYQPIIFDCHKTEIDVLFEILKEMYKRDKKVDKEMSALLQMCMSFYGDIANAKAKRAKIIQENKANFKVHLEEEKIVCEYIKRVTGDLSNLTDDEFYELFNNSFYSLINSTKFNVSSILENLTNELVYRVFKEFNLTGIELPSYTFNLNEETMIMTMSCFFEGETSDLEVSDSTEVFEQIIHMISILAQKHTLIHFKDEDEKKHYELMRTWVKAKKEEEITDQCDLDVIKDELNIVVLKVGELLNELEAKVKKAISKSSLLPVGESMLSYYNVEGLIDFNEFKQGYSKEEIQDCLKEYMELDLEDMNKRKAGR